MKRTKKRAPRASAPFNAVATQNEDGLRACFAENSLLRLDLIQHTHASIDDLMYGAGCGLVFAVTEVAGGQHLGAEAEKIR